MCTVCNGTGKQAGSGHLDCASCDVAAERARLEQWAIEHGIRCRCPDSLWAVYQKGIGDATRKAQPKWAGKPVGINKF